jgi:hypothetical protein
MHEALGSILSTEMEEGRKGGKGRTEKLSLTTEIWANMETNCLDPGIE